MWDMTDDIFFQFMILSFASWRIASLLMYERGPFDIILKFREGLLIGHDEDGDIVSYPDTFFGNVFQCMYCFSVWVGIAMTLLVTLIPMKYSFIFLLPFALSAAMVLIDTVDKNH